MRILALEFSSPRRSVAVAEVSGNTVTLLATAGSAQGRATRGLPLVQEALRRAGVERATIDRLAVGLGPGSYTGIRAAIALAQGWAVAREVPVLGLSSVDTLAAQAQAQGRRGRVSFIVDAQREELYLATYELAATAARLLEPLRLVPVETVRRLAADGRLVLGPEARRWLPDAVELCPDAAMLARLAAGRTDCVPPERLEPIYLREARFVKAPRPRVLP